MVLPHLVVMAGLAVFAWLSTDPQEPGGDTRFGGLEGDREPPLEPRPVPPVGGGGLPLPDAGTPRRRLRSHERLEELYPAAPRRGDDRPGHAPERPVPERPASR